MNEITLTINGRQITASVEPRMLLADFLRERIGAKSVHLGCEHGVCGACTILLNGQTARACIALAVECDGAQITTLEGLRDDPVMDALCRGFHTEHGLQCGYCTPGMLITAHDHLHRKADITPEGIRHAFSSNICRCTGYAGIVRAVCKAADTLASESTISAQETPHGN